MDVMDALPVKSALRSVELLEYFAAEKTPVSVMEVCEALGYPQSSTSMLLATLEGQGYLHYDRSSRNYSLAPRSMLLGAALDASDAGRVFTKVLKQLHTSTGQAVVLGVRQGSRVRQIVSFTSRNPNPIIFPNGSLRPICKSALGKVLLAANNDDQVARIARKANSEAAIESDKVSVSGLLSDVRQIRRDGWALTVDYPAPDRSALAIPIPNPNGDPLMAVAIGARSAVMAARRKEFQRHLEMTVAKLRGALA